MRADIDPDFESDVTRVLHTLRADTRAVPWTSPAARVEQAARRQNRRRASVAAASVALAVAGSALGVAVATRTPDTHDPVGGTVTALPTSAPVAPQPSANPSTAIVVPTAVLSRVAAQSASEAAAVASALAIPPDTQSIPASALPALRTIAWRAATTWGDKAATITAIYVANSTSVFAALGSLGSTPRLDTYVLEIKGQLVCRGCGSVGMPVQVLPAYYLFVDAGTLTETQASGGFPAMDLSRFGVVATIPALDPTATPRPVGPTLAPPRLGRTLTLAEAEDYALQGADDPTTAQVVFTKTVVNGDLKPSGQNLQGPDTAKVFVVGVRGARTSFGGTINEFEVLLPEVWTGGGGLCVSSSCYVAWPQ